MVIGGPTGTEAGERARHRLQVTIEDMRGRLGAAEHEAKLVAIEHSRAIAALEDQLARARVESPSDDDDDYLRVHCVGCNLGLLSGVLADMTVAGLPYDKALGTIRSDSTTAAALASLRENQTSCSLVVGADGRPLGVLTLTDAVVALLSREFTGADQPVSRAVRSYAVVKPTTSLRLLLKYFRRGYDYICAGDANLVSQGSVLRFINIHLARNPDDAASLKGLTAEASMAQFSGHMQMSDTSSLADTLRYLVASELRSLVLVGNGRSSAVFSLSDVKHLSDPASLMDRPTLDVLRDANGQIRPVVSCHPSTSAVDVLAIMVAQNVHTVVVADEDGRFAGMVTTASLLASICES